LYGQGAAIDVGTWIGYHTLRLARLAAPHSVYAYEGRPWVRRNVAATLRRNNIRNVHLVDEKDEKIGVNWSIDDVTKEALMGTTPLALVKIDCEGCELSFLRGAKEVLLRWHPVIVLEIQDDGEFNVRVFTQYHS
jgi:protein-L-isoaspartate O-methyltransferase